MQYKHEWIQILDILTMLMCDRQISEGGGMHRSKHNMRIDISTHVKRTNISVGLYR